MSTQYICQKNERGEKVAQSTTLNGIDYIEVVSVDQKTLALHFIHPLPGETNGVPATPALTNNNIIITGGVRIRNVQVLNLSAAAEVLTIQVNTAGDFSFYTLSLVKSLTDLSEPPGFDPQLAQVEFSFKAGCPSDFDCRKVKICPPEKRTEPDIDYLAKDYASFRRLILDRLNTLVPDWQERNPADGQIALVELLAYVGDQLSYYQDAVATEAYLGTARKRISVRRHARLLDYFMHEGCNARAWLALQATADGVFVKPSSQFATKGKISTSISPDSAVVFETMHDVTLWTAHNHISFYTWSDIECCLPQGATQATLKNDKSLSLQVGDLLLLEEILGPTTGNAADADGSHRHVVRLTEVSYTNDPLDNTPVANIAWGEADALPFALCLSKTVQDQSGAPVMGEISVARGNIVLADHGSTTVDNNPALISNGALRLPLRVPPLTHQGQARNDSGELVLDKFGRTVPFDSSASASTAMQWEMRDTLPVVQLTDTDTNLWLPLKDLLEAGEFTRGFVAEIDEQGRGVLRFGDKIMGEQPDGLLAAQYRVGNGRSGTVGAETITEFTDPLTGKPVPGVSAVRNPLPAQGGQDPESLEEVRQFAPQAFRVQERAVTEEDWEEVAQRHPEVQKAAARFRWTGSWLTVFVTIDRKGGLPVDADFKKKMMTYIERYRLAGYDLEVNAPVLVPLDILFTVCVKPGFFRSEVKKTLLEVFSDRDLLSGARGFFHPDNFTFGQPVFLSQLYALGMQQPGVASLEAKRFQRWGKKPNQELDREELRPVTLEIVCLQNDPNFPENGKIEFEMEGGL
jgi:hypothetical protein